MQCERMGVKGEEEEKGNEEIGRVKREEGRKNRYVRDM